DANRPITSITYNGVNLTKIRADADDTQDITTELWYLVNPASGAHNVTVNFTGNITNTSVGMAASFTGVDPTIPIDSTGTSSGSSNTQATGNITTASDSAWVVDVIYDKNDTGFSSVGVSQSSRTMVVTGPSSDSQGMSTRGPVSPPG